MGALIQQRQARDKLSEWPDLWLGDRKRAGFVAVTDFKKQWYYSSDEKMKIMTDTAGRRDLYISLNAFGHDAERKLSRRTSRLKQIRNIAVDIDQYKLGLSIAEVLDVVQALVLDGEIPEPNLILASRGVQLFYSIDGGASPDMAWLAGYITEELVSKMDHIGADYNATDMSRVMRVPETVNSRNGAVVKASIWNDEAYSLRELQDYCKPLTVKSYKKASPADVIAFPTGRIAQFHRTNWARQRDLKKLFELRGGNLTGCRNTFIYILAFQQSLILQDNSFNKVLSSVKEATRGMYTADKSAEDSDNWLENTVKSAYDGALGFLNHLKTNDYKVVYRSNDGIVKTMKTAKIINKLNITEDEQYEMSSLRNAEVKRKQHAEYMRADRRNKGGSARSEYEADRQAKKQALMSQIASLSAEGMKQKDISTELEISKSRVSQLLKEYKESVSHD